MRFLAPSRWKVAAVYRNGVFMVPDGDFKMQIGDRVVLVGEPKVVENIVNILMIGKPEFPLQYGQNIAVIANNMVEKDAIEINYFFINTRAKKYLWYDTERKKIDSKEEVAVLEVGGSEFGGTLQNFRSAAYLHDVGTLAISGSAGFGLFNGRLKYYFKKTRHPVLISRGQAPYKEVIVSLNGYIPERLIETGAEIAAHFGVSCKCIYVIPPGALKTQKDSLELENRKKYVRDYENLTRTKIPLIVLEGNPVHKILSEVDDAPNSLIIMAANSKDRISFLNPHTSFLVAVRTSNSVLILPDEDINE